MEKLKVRNLSKEFTVHTRGGIKIQGYENINFEVKKGEFLSFMDQVEWENLLF